MESVKKSIDERAQHKQEYNSWVNERQMQTTRDKQRFASQVDVNNDLSKPVTTHYLPKEREYVVAKPHHMIAPGSSRYSSNDMVHNHYLEEAKKKTQESSRNSEPSVMPSARSQSMANGSKPKPRINNQKSRNWPASKSSCVTTKTVPIAEHSRNSRSFSDSKHFVCSTCQKCVFNANHDSCVTKFLNEVNSRAEGSIQKTTKRYNLVEANKPQPDRVDSKPQNGSKDYITNQYECKQTLDVSACTLNIRAAMTSDHNSLELGIHDHNNELLSSKLVPKVVPPADKTDTSRQELELLFHHQITMLREEMPPKIELTLGSITTRSVMRMASTAAKPYQGDSLNLHDHMIHKDGDGDAFFQLKMDSLPHAHAQTTKTYYKHQDSRIMKAQELKTKTPQKL
ncbi:hypothetical protein Tco_0199006 [Tanacetum coccineum]